MASTRAIEASATLVASESRATATIEASATRAVKPFTTRAVESSSSTTESLPDGTVVEIGM